MEQLTLQLDTMRDRLVVGDCVRLMMESRPNWADLIFADPPFNIGFTYDGYDDRRPDAEYLRWSEQWMLAAYHSLKVTGSFYIAIGDEYAADLCVIARRKLGLHLRSWIIWHYTFGQQPKRKFARSHTHIFHFTKHAELFVFNADAIRVPSARQTVYKDARANSKGKLPDDVWFLRPQDAAEHFAPEGDTWYERRLCGTFKEREGWHGCQMPLAILERIVRVSSNPGDVVLDPFCGSGTTPHAAAKLGRCYVGIDQSQDYITFARERLARAAEETT